MPQPTHVKVEFHLEQDEDGYPPVVRENLWAVDLGDGTYRIDNIPFFVKGLSDGDVISATTGEDGRLIFADVKQATLNSTFRLVIPNEIDSGDARQRLRELGCPSELFGGLGLIAVHIPEAVAIQPVAAFIEQGERDGRWDFEEGILRHPDSGFTYLPN